jgi:tRNA G18 (ribose-2'-O)-methylase SpoU
VQLISGDGPGAPQSTMTMAGTGASLNVAVAGSLVLYRLAGFL